MAFSISFNDLRKIKDLLPDGAMGMIASKLGINEDTVRNFFGGTNYDKGKPTGVHCEQGPDGGIVKMDDPSILEIALEMIKDKAPDLVAKIAGSALGGKLGDVASKLGGDKLGDALGGLTDKLKF